MNFLYYGDNLDVLRRYIKDESVDLVYLDPPFKSNQDYNILFAEKDGTAAAAQFKAFEDTWEWNQASAATYQEIVEAGGRVSDVMQAFRRFLGTNDMLAYLTMMAPRLVELRRTLKRKGSIYLHCDPTASHYLKVLMDAVFGPESFSAEITWQRTGTHSDAKRWSPVADILLQYSKAGDATWNPLHIPHSEEYIEDKYRFRDSDGRRYCLDNMTSPKPRPNMMYEWKGHRSPPFGWRYSIETMAALDAEARIWYPDSKSKRPRLKRYLDEMAGVLMGNVWTDIDPINSRAAERLGYPTQKPESLLERIVEASSNPGDVVLDPFCGCGTAIAVAQRLNRKWIGIDITHLAVGLIKSRLFHAFGASAAKTYQVRGEPVDLQGATQLAREDPFQFQWWSLGLVGARRNEQRRGRDQGIDGRLFFHDETESGRTKQIILSVKSGHVSVKDVRDLRGVIEREKAEIGALLTLEEATKPMEAEAAAADFYKSRFGAFPKLQVRTIAQLLEGKGLDYPHVPNVTFKRAPKAEMSPAEEQLSLGGMPALEVAAAAFPDKRRRRKRR